MRIDPHVHCRDEEQNRKATIAGTITLAHDQGVDIIFDMPNCERPVTTRERVSERLALVPKGEEKSYRLFVGLTGENKQTDEAVWCYNNVKEVVGLKMFAGKSVGNLSVTEYEDQRRVFQRLEEDKFRGVIAVHCENEQFIHPELWDPKRPITHTRARPKDAEIESIIDQIDAATEAGFQGRLHICHVSCPESVGFIHRAKAKGLKVSCGVTPHHIMWDDSKLGGEDGLLYKMNPPLRSKMDVESLRRELNTGMIDVIETDHAPHTPEEKMQPQCLSGYPSLTLYHKFVTQFLPDIGLTTCKIDGLTCYNVLEIWGEKLES